MPGWKFYRDADDNTYYLDSNGKIFIHELPGIELLTVSAAGIDYYLNCALEFQKSGKQVHALALFKSVLCLPSVNQKVEDARGKAASEISKMRKKQGGRFDEYNEKSFLQLYFHDGSSHVVNDDMMYSFRVEGDIRLIRKTLRKDAHYKYEGIQIGVPAPGEGKNSGKFTVLIALDSERFKSEIRKVGDLKANWENNTAGGHIGKSLKNSGRNFLLYEFDDNKNSRFSGLEAYHINRNYGYFIRVVSSSKDYSRNKAFMEKIIESFRIVLI